MCTDHTTVQQTTSGMEWLSRSFVHMLLNCWTSTKQTQLLELINQAE